MQSRSAKRGACSKLLELGALALFWLVRQSQLLITLDVGRSLEICPIHWLRENKTQGALTMAHLAVDRDVTARVEKGRSRAQLPSQSRPKLDIRLFRFSYGPSPLARSSIGVRSFNFSFVWIRWSLPSLSSSIVRLLQCQRPALDGRRVMLMH